MSSIPNPKLYELTRSIAHWYFNTFYDYTQSGKEHIPAKGPVIFAANHVSFYDPPAIGACLHRQINYFARDTLFKGLFGKGLVQIGTIPVARENAEMKSLRAIFNALKAGGAVAIYPEGTRSPDGQLAEPKAGAGMIACKSRATIIPTRVFAASARSRKSAAASTSPTTAPWRPKNSIPAKNTRSGIRKPHEGSWSGSQIWKPRANMWFETVSGFQIMTDR